MSLEQHPRLQEAIDLGYEFDIGKYISDGFELCKQNLGNFVAYTFVFLAIAFAVGIIPFVGNIASIVIMPPLAVGWFIVAKKIQTNEPSEFSDFFRGFDFIGPLILVRVVQTVIYIAIMIPFIVASFSYLEMFTDPFYMDTYELEDDFPYWAFLLMVPILYLATAWRWAPMFVIFHKMGFWEAMETSRRLVTQRWFSHFALLLVYMLFAIGGVLAFFVGLIFVMPIIFCIEYAAFADVTQFLQEAAGDEGDDLVEHLVE